MKMAACLKRLRRKPILPTKYRSRLRSRVITAFCEDTLTIGQFIPLHYHYNMLNDEARMDSFEEAINALVPTGAKVLELGGGTGVLSHFAARKASKVWCVERNPELVREARRILSLNLGGERVEVVEADAFDYLPPEPVDVVICEMLHVGMLREKQIAVIDSFKQRYFARFHSLPVFIPEAAIQAVQPIQRSFEFHRYYAPVPIFEQPDAIQVNSRELGPPALYQMFEYVQELPKKCAWDGVLTMQEAGTLNALRFITKNILAVLQVENRTVDWFSQYMIMPLGAPIKVAAGEEVRVCFSYEPGANLSALTESLIVERQASRQPVH